MQDRKHHTHAVIMGDLVDSQSARSIDGLHRQFNDAIAYANRTYEKAITSPLTITLGDEFQGLCRDLHTGMEIIRDVRTMLINNGVECRFVLGLANIETPLNVEKSWNMMGQGLAAARKKLNDKHDPNAYRFQLPDDVIEPLLNTIGLSLTLIEREWTERQKEVLSIFRNSSGTVSEHATKLGVTPRTLYKIRTAARLDFYENQWEVVNQTIAKLDQRYHLA